MESNSPHTIHNFLLDGRLNDVPLYDDLFIIILIKTVFYTIDDTVSNSAACDYEWLLFCSFGELEDISSELLTTILLVI